MKNNTVTGQAQLLSDGRWMSYISICFNGDVSEDWFGPWENESQALEKTRFLVDRFSNHAIKTDTYVNGLDSPITTFEAV